MKKNMLLVIFLLFLTDTINAQEQFPKVKNLKITILSTMLAQRGIGEWGFSALVEADSIKILFDVGAHEKTVLENCKDLNIDLSNVPTLILSHSHDDHTTGWIPLRNAMKSINNNAMSLAHVAPGFFDTRISSTSNENKSRQKDSVLYIQSGGKIIEHKNFEEISPNIFLTGLVPRKYPEKNYAFNAKKYDALGNIIEDNIPEDMSLVINTEKGLVILSGCGHSGIINTIEHIRNNMQNQAVVAAIGGFHLYQNSDEEIKWTATQLKASGLRYFMGAHCTGIEPVYQIREWANLKRGECIVGSVGASFELNKGFTAGPLTK